MAMIAKPFTLLLLSFFLILFATSLAISYEGEILMFPGEAGQGGEANPTREMELGAQGRRNPSYLFGSYRRFFDRKKINLPPEDCVTACQESFELCIEGCGFTIGCQSACRIAEGTCVFRCG